MHRRTSSTAATLVLSAIATISILLAGTATAASFNIVYDTITDESIGTIVGFGTFSYAGAPTVGSFALSSLVDISYNVSFADGALTFTTADILADPTLSGIYVYSLGSGEFGLVFT